MMAWPTSCGSFMPANRLNARAITATNHKAADRRPGAAAAELPDDERDQCADSEDCGNRQHPADVKCIAEHLREAADHVERQRRIIVDDQRIGRRIERRRAHGSVGKIGVPAFVLRDLDGKAGAPQRPNHEISGKQREQRDLSIDSEPAPRRARHRARPATRSSARSTSSGSGVAPLPPTTSIGPDPIGPVRPGLAADEDRNQRHPERRRHMHEPGVDADHELRSGDQGRDFVERPSLGHAFSGLAGGGRDRLAALAFGLSPQGSTTSMPRARMLRATAIQLSIAHSLPGCAVP